MSKPSRIKMYRQGDILIRSIESKSGARLQHPDHAPIDLPQGRYEVVRQREYDPDLDDWNTVAD